jgi:CheY-like chemotaxis protein/tetratricopeptide (TPR) repeat protein
MYIQSQLVHRIADPTLTHDERTLLRCQLSKELEEIGNYEAAREAMGELWQRIGERPNLEGLERATAAEVLLRVGILTGQIGSVKLIENAQELAKDLISESITSFEVLGDLKKVAEAQTELAQCYWREAAYDAAGVMLSEALSRLDVTDSKLKAVALYRSAIVAKLATRHNDALRFYTEAAPLFEEISNDSLKGKFHNGFANLLVHLGQTERRSDYIDRAFIEFTAASYHFEQAGHRRYQACVENNIGYLFYTIKKFPEAHRHLDRAQALFTSMKDSVHTAQVDDTRAKVLLAEGRIPEAERLVRSAVQTLERGGEQSLLAEALTTHGIALARIGSHRVARLTLQRAVEVAQNAGDTEGAGLAALIILEELAGHMEAHDLSATYDRAAELLASSVHQDHKDRLLVISRRVLYLIGTLPTPPTWKGFNLYDAVLRFEARIIERALREAGGIVARAAQLLGIERRSLDAMLHKGRHKALAHLRPPVEPRRRSLMFRDEVDCPDTRAVSILHVEDNPTVADAVQVSLADEGWSVEICRDGAEALERLESGARYDVLIFDNHLSSGGMDGVELIRRARALAHRQQTPIIMLSGNADVEMQARRAGANAFLRKPADMPLIAETVARLLARRKGKE